MEKKDIELRNGQLVNLIMDYAIKNAMSLKEIDDCMEKVQDVFYNDGLIRKE